MKPVEIPYTRSARFTKEKMFTTAPEKAKRIPRKLKKKRNKQKRGQ